MSSYSAAGCQITVTVRETTFRAWPFWIHLAAAKHPDRVAIEGPERSLTYAELRAAGDLRGGRDRGARARGERVALALAPGEEFVVALHGCLLAGAAAVPIDLRLSEEERARRLAGAELVVSEPLREATAATPFAFAGDPPVAVMHTSGTTAAPEARGAHLRNFQASALGSAVALGLDPAERWLCPMPLTHVGGLSIPIRSAIYATTAVLHGRFDTEAVLDELMDPAPADHARLARADDARPAARRRARAPADAPVGAARRRPDRRRRCWNAREQPAFRWRRRTG